jgi:hypothetical protein
MESSEAVVDTRKASNVLVETANPENPSSSVQKQLQGIVQKHSSFLTSNSSLNPKTNTTKFDFSSAINRSSFFFPLPQPKSQQKRFLQ